MSGPGLETARAISELGAVKRQRFEDRQRRAIALKADGLTNCVIAARLGVSDSTVARLLTGAPWKAAAE
jgi:DNA-binding NarL/FixJ family response regulator